MALLLPLNDLHGEIRGMVGNNMLKTQLQTGMIGKPSIAAFAKERGAMSFALSQRDHEVNDANKGESRKQNLEVKNAASTAGDNNEV